MRVRSWFTFSVFAILLSASLAAAPQASSGASDELARLVAPTAPHERVAAAWDLDGPARYAILHFHVDSLPTVVFGIETPQGDPVMIAYADGNVLKASNGAGPTATIGPISRGWHRVDLRLDGASYSLALDEDAVATLATTVAATEGAFSDRLALQDALCGCPGSPIEIARARFLPDGAVVTSFAAPVSAWIAHDPHDAVQVQTHTDGALGTGVLDVSSGKLAPVGVGDELGYVSTDVSGMGGAYVAEASFRPGFVSTLADGIPDHQAVLAGISGDAAAPEVHWALVMAAAGAGGVDQRTWGLFLLGPDGSRTPVSPTWTALDPPWHHTRVRVDEAAGTMLVQVDDASTSLRFDFESLAPSARVATGDVSPDVFVWTGNGAGKYDNLAVWHDAATP